MSENDISLTNDIYNPYEEIAKLQAQLVDYRVMLGLACGWLRGRGVTSMEIAWLEEAALCV